MARKIIMLPIAALLAVITISTLSAGGAETWGFAVVGDSRNNPEIFCKLTSLIKNDVARPEFVVHTGDMVGECKVKYQWVDYRKCIDILGKDLPVYPVIGNHELKGGTHQECMETYLKEAAPFKGKTYYAFKHRNAGIIVLDSEQPGFVNAISPEQIEWLKKGLAKDNKDTRLFVFLHRPPFPSGVYKNQPLRNANQLHEMLQKAGVTAVFNGHEHMYAHVEKDGVHYFTSAGGGAPLYKGYGGEFFHYMRVVLMPNQVVVHIVDETGQEREVVTIPVQ